MTVKARLRGAGLYREWCDKHNNPRSIEPPELQPTRVEIQARLRAGERAIAIARVLGVDIATVRAAARSL